MAVIISNGNTTLATASGFYRVEAHNLAMFSTTDLSLSSARTIAVTFANAGNCQGLVLSLVPSAAASLKNVTVKLQEFVLGVWTDRASVTLTAAQISNSVADASSDGWVVPFTGGTFPYAVSTVPGIWRFEVSNATGTNNWSLRTSDATNPFYATWCDNAVTFATNDCVIVKDTVVIDTTCTFKGVLGTGDATRSVCGIICRSTTPTPDNVSLLKWENPAISSYTLTLDGLLVLGSHSGFRAGTSGSPIAYAQKGEIILLQATSGTAANTGFTGTEHTNNAHVRKSSIFIYGEVPAVERTLLNGAVSVGATSFVTTDSTGWVNGDKICICGQNVTGNGEVSDYTVSSVSGTTVNLTSAILTNARSTGTRVFRRTGYGMKLSAGTSVTCTFQHPSNFYISGCEIIAVIFSFGGASGVYDLDDSANRSTHTVSHCSMTAIASAGAFLASQLYRNGLTFSYVNAWKMQIGTPSPNYVNFTSGTFTMDSCVHFQQNNYGFNPYAFSGIIGQIFTNNEFYCCNGRSLNFSGITPTITGNRFWGISNSSGFAAMELGTVLLPSVCGSNQYDRCSVGVAFQSSANSNVIGLISSNDLFGTVSANSYDIYIHTGSSYLQVEFQSPTGSLVVDDTNKSRMVNGSKLSISDDNDVANVDKNILPYGYIVRTGYALSDTTVRTSGTVFGAASAGKFAMRMQPTSGTVNLEWPTLVSERAIPTGNIQNKTMTVSIWVDIANTAYDAGTYIFPKLNVKYDNATTVTSTASATFGSGQLLSVTFTPTTTYGQIEVWLTAATDATTTNAYVYWDDFNIAYPAGVNLDLGAIDLWAHAFPVWPPIATNPAPGSLWDEAVSAHAITGSFGALVPQIDVKADDVTALVLTK